MIKDNKTIDGIPIEKLTIKSSKRIIRVCDLCTKEDSVAFKDYLKQKNNRLVKNVEDKDTCYKCRYKIFTPHNKGKPLDDHHKKLLMDGHKKYAENAKFTKIIDGYAIKYKDNKQIMVHRDNYETHYKEKLTSLDVIHHINVDSLDNRPENLIKLTFSEHSQLHRDLEKFAISFIKTGGIVFDRMSKSYTINPELLIKTMPISLSFKDVAIQQNESVCQSRLEVNTESEIIRGVVRPVPLIASNMLSVSNAQFCINLFDLGAMGIMHRADTDENLISSVEKIASCCEWAAASIGVNTSDIDLAKKLIKAGANIIVIDVAHGFNQTVFDMARYVKLYSYKTKVVIGNTNNTSIFKKGLKYIDSVKLGIANGLACETKNTAGCNEGQFSTVFKFKQISKDLGIPVISDGSIREPADFVKSIAAGANSAMAGSIFARCPESAAEVIEIEGVSKKVYAGMASRYVQNKWKGSLKEGTCTEGKVVYLDVGESVEKLIERYSGALRSGITYAGGKDIKTFQENVEFIRLK